MAQEISKLNVIERIELVYDYNWHIQFIKLKQIIVDNFTQKLIVMSFQILDSEKNAIKLRDLDAEVGLLWNKPIDPKYYCTPFEKRGDGVDAIFSEGVNWFDSLGWNIHFHKVNSWSEARDTYYASAGKLAKGNGEKYQIYCQIYKPYFQLIDHWESKGYTPHFVME